MTPTINARPVTYYFIGGRAAGEWRETSAPVADMNRMGFVAVAGDRNNGAPEGPPSDAKFRAIGM